MGVIKAQALDKMIYLTSMTNRLFIMYVSWYHTISCTFLTYILPRKYFKKCHISIFAAKLKFDM